MLATDELVRKATTTTTNLQALIPKIWAALLEKNLRRQAVLQQSVVSNTDLLGKPGDTVYIPLLPDLAQADPLTEGTDMTPYALTNATNVPFVPQEYGKVVEITRKALDRIGYDGIAEIVDRLSYAMSLRIEGNIAALYNQTVPGTSNSLQAIYANGKTSSTITSSDTFNDVLLLQGIAYLAQLNNHPFEDGYYRLYVSPTQYEALLLDPNVRQDLRFAAPERLLNGEVGILHGCRVIITNYVPVDTENSIPVYNALLVAPRWAAIAWKRMPEVIVDPTLYDMGRRRRIGVVADFDVELLHAERAVVLKSA